MHDFPHHSSQGRALLPPIRLGAVTLESPVILAPMSGVTDGPFRRIVRTFGNETAVTEMLASKAVIRECRKTLRMARKEPGEGVLVVQLAGRDPEVIAEAARLNEDLGADVIDLNFGCPVKKVVKDLVGSALMRDEVHAAKIFEAVVSAVKLPVTLKMRLGWDRQSINAPRLARIAEECGVRMVTVHGRTRCQFYGGEADWSAVRAVKDAVAMPVVVNGDIRDYADVTRALELSGADGVMIGRAAYGRPWVVSQIGAFLRGDGERAAPGLRAQYETAREHFEGIVEYYGARAGVMIARKHLAWYSAGLPEAEVFRAAVNKTEDATQVRRLMEGFWGARLG